MQELGTDDPLSPLPGKWGNLPLWQDFPLANKRVLIREDFNVPLSDSASIRDDSRLRASLPGLQKIIANGASLMVLSHLGRPKPNEIQDSFSLQPVAQWFSDKLGTEVPLLKDNWLHSSAPQAGSMAICENVRFMAGETDNSPDFAKALGGLCDIYINDAFAVSHRKHASVYGVAEYAPQSCIGPLMYQEIKNLALLMNEPQPPVVAIVGGAKLDSKMGVLQALLPKVDTLILGGGLANALLAAKGHKVGKSMDNISADSMRQAEQLLSGKYAAKLALPEDVVVATEISASADTRMCAIDSVGSEDIILDIGLQSRNVFAKLLDAAGTIIWSGPPGLFELDNFAGGTRSIAEAVAASKAFSVAGGGDTLAAISASAVSGDISYLSTGGSAFLSFLETGTLPALEIISAGGKG